MLDSPLWNAADVAKYLKVSRSYVYRLADEGVLPCVRIPQIRAKKKDTVRFSVQDVMDFIERHYRRER